MAASVAACMALFGGASAQAADVQVSYDLTSSALHVDYDEVNGLDWYTSLPLDLGGVTLTAGDPTLTVNVTFRSATNVPQVLLLDQMGLGGAQNAPTTFGSPSFIGSGVAGGHGFGPSLVLAGSGLQAGTATLVPTVYSGALNGTFTGGLFGACGSAASCDYGVLFPDLIDGNTTIGLSGFSVTFDLGPLGSPAQVNVLSFNVIAPAIAVLQVPEPGSVALMLAGLGAVGALARRRRGRA
jgi:hypothetical protein